MRLRRPELRLAQARFLRGGSAVQAPEPIDPILYALALLLSAMRRG